MFVYGYNHSLLKFLDNNIYFNGYTFYSNEFNEWM